MLLGGGLLAVFGSEAIELGGAGPLAVVAAAFVSCYFWQKQGWEIDDVSTFTYSEVAGNSASIVRSRVVLFINIPGVKNNRTASLKNVVSNDRGIKFLK